jgi:membrane protein YqaA with SNARE-associated domain
MNNLRRIIRIFAWVVLALTLFFFVYGITHYSAIKDMSQSAVQNYGLPAMFLISFFLDLFPQFLSGHNLVLVAGILSFNPFSVIVVVLIATFLASVVGFWLGKNLEEDVFKEIFGKKIYNKIDKGMKKYGRWYSAVSAVTPLPYVPIIYGALDMEWKDFLLFGVIPRMVGFVVTAILLCLSLLEFNNYYLIRLFLCAIMLWGN